MQERMTNTFGDLSAVRGYVPPARETAPVSAAPYTGQVTHTLSDAAPSPAAGPMQAKRRDADARGAKALQRSGRRLNEQYALPSYPGYKNLNPRIWEERTHTPGFSRYFGKKPQTFKVRKKASYMDFENITEYDKGVRLTRLHNKPMEAEPDLREDEDADIVSEEMLKAFQKENNATLDRMYHIRAGMSAEYDMNRGPSVAMKDQKTAELRKEAAKKGLTGNAAEDYVDDMLDEYVKENKPKKPHQLVTKEDRDWYEYMTSYGMNEDLLNAIHDKTVQSGKALVDYRKDLGAQNPNTSSDKLDFITAYSGQSRDFALYRDMMSDVNSDANPSLRNHIEKLKTSKRFLENEPMLDFADRLFRPGVESNNSFVKSEEGQAMLPVYEKMDTAANRALYEKMKKQEEDTMKKEMPDIALQQQ